VGKDQSDDEEDYMVSDDATPMTNANRIKKAQASKVKKLGKTATFFSLLKGFVATAILYLPDSFHKAGWLF